MGGGRTVPKTVRFDLHVVEEFAPNIVILQLGTNDLTTTSAVETGSAIEDLSQLLHESYGVQVVCVCQTIYRLNSPYFNKQVDLLTKYLMGSLILYDNLHDLFCQFMVEMQLFANFNFLQSSQQAG